MCRNYTCVCYLCTSSKTYPAPCTCRTDLKDKEDSEIKYESKCDPLERYINIHFIEHEKCTANHPLNPIQKALLLADGVNKTNQQFSEILRLNPNIVSYSADEPLYSEVRMFGVKFP